MRTRVVFMVIIGTVVALSACIKNTATNVSSPQTHCEPPETMNGYKDNDNCRDELARLRIHVTDKNQQPLSGIRIFLPGMSVPEVTSSTGSVMLFELLPVPSIQLELRNPLDDASVTINTTLKEGENTLHIPTEWLPATSSK